MSSLTKDGITWTFAAPARVGQFVNGDYYVVGTTTIVDIQPLPTPANGRHGTMLNVRPNVQRSGFDSRIQASRYDPGPARVPSDHIDAGKQAGLLPKRREASNPPCVMRPI